MKKSFKASIAFLILSIVAVATVFTGCGSGSSSKSSGSGSVSSSYTTDSATGSERGEESNQTIIADGSVTGEFSNEGLLSQDVSQSNAALENRKIIKSASFKIETKDFATSLKTLEAVISSSGSYTEYSTSQGTTQAQTASADYTVRVPVTEYQAFKQAMETVGSIYGSSEGGEDVTTQYFDIDSRLAALKTQETRLLEFLAASSTIEDMLTIEEKLAAVRYEIEQLTTNLRRFDNLIEYATVEINLQQTTAYTPLETQSFWGRVSEAFSGSFKSALEFLQGVIVNLIWTLPYLLICGIIAVFAVVITRTVARRRRNNPKPIKPTLPTMQPPYNPQQPPHNPQQLPHNPQQPPQNPQQPPQNPQQPPQNRQ